MTGLSVFGVIIYKLSYWYKLSLVILFKIDQSLKIYLQDTVLPLNLTVFLQVNRSKKLPLNVKVIAKQ